MKKKTKLIIILITVSVILFVRYRRAKKAVSSSGQTNESGSGFFKPDLFPREPNVDLFESSASGSSGSMVNSGKIKR